MCFGFFGCCFFINFNVLQYAARKNLPTRGIHHRWYSSFLLGHVLQFIFCICRNIEEISERFKERLVYFCSSIFNFKQFNFLTVILCLVLLETKKDTKYWSNPQVYITCDRVSQALNGPHFILYKFKTSHLLPLDDTLKSISVMGELRYKVCVFCWNCICIYIIPFWSEHTRDTCHR